MELAFDKYSVKSSVDDWSGDVWLRLGSGNKRAWSGCKRALDGRRCLFPLLSDGVGEPLGKYVTVFGDGDA